MILPLFCRYVALRGQLRVVPGVFVRIYNERPMELQGWSRGKVECLVEALLGFLLQVCSCIFDANLIERNLNEFPVLYTMLGMEQATRTRARCSVFVPINKHP